MSLEASIKELNDNIVALTAALKAGGAPAKAAANDAGDGKAEKTEGKRGPGRPPKDESKGGGKADKTTKAPSDDEIRKVFGDFMRVDDEDERESRKNFVKGVLKEYGVAKATDLKPEDRAEAISVIEDEAKKRDADNGGDEDDDLV